MYEHINDKLYIYIRTFEIGPRRTMSTSPSTIRTHRFIRARVKATFLRKQTDPSYVVSVVKVSCDT